MKLHLFANRIHRVYFSGGSVVIEFCVLKPNENGEVLPDTPVTDDDVPFAVTIPLAGLVRSIGVLRKHAEDLQKKGILKKPEGDDRRNRMRKQNELTDLTDGNDGDEPVM